MNENLVQKLKSRYKNFDATDVDAWLERRDELGTMQAISEDEGVPLRTITRHFSLVKEYALMQNEDAVIKGISLTKSLQRARDENNVMRKYLREGNREINVIEALNEQLIDALKEVPKVVAGETFSTDFDPDVCVGVIQLSDLHLGEQVEFDFNKYNWNIASKRIKLHVNKALADFKSKGVKQVMLALTGDLINSDRRFDEMLLNANNRIHTMIQAVHLLRQVCSHVASEGFSLAVASVVGNESRVGQDVHFSKVLASDNYDTSIFELLKYTTDGIKFLESDNPLESIVEIGKEKILLYHGHTGKGRDLEKKLAQFITKYANLGIVITYAMSGHIHCAHVSERFARSGSTVGANEYSSNALNLASAISQNYYLVNPKGGVCGVVNVLKDHELSDGYDIDEEFAVHNKLKSSTNTVKTVLEIKI